MMKETAISHQLALRVRIACRTATIRQKTSAGAQERQTETREDDIRVGDGDARRETDSPRSCRARIRSFEITPYGRLDSANRTSSSVSTVQMNTGHPFAIKRSMTASSTS